ncbi:hypothetical protein IMSAG049_00320 [Clostridiales bacterium]|nr:hypothetical protein IMSAG049_00320 [Clostridiales bacterium]
MDYKNINLKNIDALSALFADTFNSPPWGEQWTSETAKKRLSMMLDGEAAYGLEAYDSGNLCGLIIGCFEQYYDGVVFNLREFCIKNPLRGSGLGSEMFTELETKLRERRVKEITLNTIRVKATVGFYLKCGMLEDDSMAVMIKKL